MTEQEERGRTVVAAIERMLSSDEEIVGVVENARRRASSPADAAKLIVRRYANASAVAGGMAAAPSMVPGWGALAALGTVTAEMVYLLKVEVEMCLALVSLFDMDLRNEQHRNVAFVLAATTTHEATTGRNLFVDVTDAGMEAIWTYSPRELWKLILSFFGKVAVHHLGQRAGLNVVRALPVVSVGVGAGVNYTLTRRAGRLAVMALDARQSTGVFVDHLS